MIEKIKLLFLCTGNSCRSQMAEGLTRAIKGEKIEVRSAGIEKHGLNKNAVEVMNEIGIDISEHESKLIEELDIPDFDYVITLCGHAGENCPYFPGKVMHRGFDDPPALAKGSTSHEEELSHYRRVRDEIRKFIETLPESLS